MIPRPKPIEQPPCDDTPAEWNLSLCSELDGTSSPNTRKPNEQGATKRLPSAPRNDDVKLGQRLEKWMQRVDSRLDILLLETQSREGKGGPERPVASNIKLQQKDTEKEPEQEEQQQYKAAGTLLFSGQANTDAKVHDFRTDRKTYSSMNMFSASRTGKSTKSNRTTRLVRDITDRFEPSSWDSNDPFAADLEGRGKDFERRVSHKADVVRHRVLEAKVPHRARVEHQVVKCLMVPENVGETQEDGMHAQSTRSKRSSGACQTKKIQMQARAVQQFATRPSVGDDPFERNASTMEAKVLKKRLTEMSDVSTKACVVRMVLHPFFDTFISIVLLLNAGLIGAHVQWAATGREPDLTLDVLDFVCTFVFTVELFLRIYVHRMRFFKPPEHWYALLDVVLVGLSLLDVAWIIFTDDHNSNNLAWISKLLRTLRMFRILRLLRMLKFIDQLRVLVLLIAQSFLSLFWLIVLLAATIYVFATVLTAGVTQHIKNHEGPESLKVFYGTLWDSMYTLFKAICGGVSWGEMASPLQAVGPFHFMIFLAYISITIFSVLNLVTGVFCDSAIEMANLDRAVIIKKRNQQREASAAHLLDLLTEIDTDGDGTITHQEFLAGLQREQVQQNIDALQIDLAEAELLFFMLDKDGDGTIDTREFVNGMLRFKGEASSFDIHMLVLHNRQILYMCAEVLDLLGMRESDIPPQVRNRMSV